MRTNKVDMVAFVAELIELHMEQCSDKYPGDAIPHIFDEDEGTGVDIDYVANDGDKLHLKLSDGAAFTLQFSDWVP